VQAWRFEPDGSALEGHPFWAPSAFNGDAADREDWSKPLIRSPMATAISTFGLRIPSGATGRGGSGTCWFSRRTGGAAAAGSSGRQAQPPNFKPNWAFTGQRQRLCFSESGQHCCAGSDDRRPCVTNQRLSGASGSESPLRICSADSRLPWLRLHRGNAPFSEIHLHEHPLLGDPAVTLPAIFLAGFPVRVHGAWPMTLSETPPPLMPIFQAQ